MSLSTKNQRSAKILVVDDDPTVSRVLEFQLVKVGYSVTMIARGMPAVEVVRREDPDAVILDLQLPDTTGIEVLRSIREADGERRRPIIVLSATVHDEHSLAALRVEADSVQCKPIGPSSLKRKLAELNVPPRIEVPNAEHAYADLA
ncbi:MAG: response regulator [Isosphaeraceae bacterium]|nr:response regulator [Isosphaeraceae bacterium]